MNQSLDEWKVCNTFPTNLTHFLVCPPSLGFDLWAQAKFCAIDPPPMQFGFAHLIDQRKRRGRHVTQLPATDNVTRGYCFNEPQVRYSFVILHCIVICVLHKHGKYGMIARPRKVNFEHSLLARHSFPRASVMCDSCSGKLWVRNLECKLSCLWTICCRVSDCSWWVVCW